MRVLKRILPFFLAAAIIVGGFFGIYGLEKLIPSYKDTIVRSDKRTANQLLYVEEWETLAVYPWDLYNPEETIPLSKYVNAIGADLTEFGYYLDNLVYTQSIFPPTSETEVTGKPNEEGYFFFQNIEEVLDSMEFMPECEFGFLHEKSCKDLNGNEYLLSLAVPGYSSIRYFHMVPTGREDVSKEEMRRANEELERIQGEAKSLYEEYIKYIQTEEYDVTGEYGEETSDGGQYDDSIWKIYFEKFGVENPLIQYIAVLSEASGTDPYYFGDVLIFQEYYSFSYDNEILLVFSTPEEGALTDSTIVLYYDPVKKKFTGYSFKM